MEFAIYLDTSWKNKIYQLEKLISKNKNISRIYFGEEFCEELIPTLKDTKEIFTFSQKNNLNFTYLTGYLTDHGINKQRKIINFLNKHQPKDKKIEIVANEWGLAYIVATEYKKLTLVLGRMMTKMQRMPRYVKKPPVPYPHLIGSTKLWSNQQKILSDSNLSVPVYRNFLRKQGVNRIDLDLVPQGINLKKKWGFHFSFYTPWTYITGGRNCDLAGVSNSEQARYITKKPCSKLCKNYYIKFETGPGTTSIIQKGNSLFFKNSILISKFKKQKVFDRVIFENLFLV